jgi:hypothetical protein
VRLKPFEVLRCSIADGNSSEEKLAEPEDDAQSPARSRLRHDPNCRGVLTGHRGPPHGERMAARRQTGTVDNK